MRPRFDSMVEIYLTRAQLERLYRHCREEPAGALARALKKRGDKALTAGPFTVMDKTLTPPSGDKHDFLRMPTYAWPNPDTPDGLPYIIRDGEAGPGINGPEYDTGRLRDFTTAVINLAWAVLATGGSVAYAKHAVHLLRVWFLDPATRMNPNLTYSKYTLGDDPPYATGVIATHKWVSLTQALGILAGSPAWSEGLADGLRQWFRDYLAWLQTSDQGRAERRFDNNRGTWYDAQRAAYACFVGDDDLACRILGQSCPRRLDTQIAADGRLPAELRRTNSFGYTLMTLRGWAMLALMGERLDRGLWHWRSDDSRDLRLAFDYPTPFIGRPEQWPHQQIKPVSFRKAVFPYCAARQAYADAALGTPLERLDDAIVRTQPATVLFNSNG